MNTRVIIDSRQIQPIHVSNKRKHNKMKKTLLMLLALSAFAVGCVTNTGTGALGGGALGALAGQAIGGDTKSTLIGGAIGAAVGGAIGNQEDAKNQNKKE